MSLFRSPLGTADPSASADRGRLRVEPFGTDHIPDTHRKSSPKNLLAILFGGSMTFSVIVIGAFPIAFGLSWWQAASAIVVGSALGAAFLAPTGIIAPRTGTNNPVSSGAFFGVVGRIIGSVLGIVGSLIFAALSVWTGGDALAGAIIRIFGTSESDWVRVLSYAVIAAIVTLISVLGHGSMVFMQRLMVPTAGFCMLLGIFVFSGDFSASYPGAGAYLLGSSTATWFLSVLICASTVSSYGPFTGDWTRHISPTHHEDLVIMRTLFLGGLFGLGGPFMWGAFIAVCLVNAGVADPSATFVLSLAEQSPMWYLPAVLFLGLASGTAQAVINTYGTGLDTSSMISRLSRTQATLVACLVATALVYVGHYYSALVTWMSTVLTLLANFTVPWIVILCLGHFALKGVYRVDDLQVFNHGERGGAYWYTNGVNVGAVLIWVSSSLVGLLFSNNVWFTGPGSAALGGIDIGFLLAAVLAGVMFWIGPVRSLRVPAIESRG